MGISAPPFLNGFLDAGTMARNAAQQQKDGKVTPAAADLNARVQQLPVYQRYMQARTSHQAGSDPSASQDFAAVMDTLGVPKDVIFDPYTGQFRQKNWNERNSNWSALLYSGAAIGAGLGAGAAIGAFAAGGAGAAGAAATGSAGAGIGETGAVTGLAGSGFGTGAGLGYSAVPALGGAASAAASAPSALGELAGNGVGIGEQGASEGLSAAGQASLPGQTGLLGSTTAGIPVTGALPNVASSGAVGEALAGGGSASSLFHKLGETPKSALGDILGAAGAGISAATRSSGDTQLENAKLGLQANNSNIAANNSNISGTSAFEQELMARADQESKERRGGLANIYRDSLVENPQVSPFNPKGAPVYSDQYKSALKALSSQGMDDITAPRQYGSRVLPALAPYSPMATNYNPATVTGPGGTQPSTLQRVGQWLGPGVSTLGILSKYFDWGDPAGNYFNGSNPDMAHLN